ncbi:hypothetical protein [Methylocystis echinoides]|uniref:hypothetical protein n=1 Tax=Methylocystis echinoides TaxID=29468 RepID=UPI00343256FB
MSAPLPRDALARLAAGKADAADIKALAAAAQAKTLRLVYPRGGRKQIDDSAALAEVAEHVREGLSPPAATRLVARAAPGHSVEATQKRLRRKFKKTRNKTN